MRRRRCRGCSRPGEPSDRSNPRSPGPRQLRRKAGRAGPRRGGGPTCGRGASRSRRRSPGWPRRRDPDRSSRSARRGEAGDSNSRRPAWRDRVAREWSTGRDAGRKAAGRDRRRGRIEHPRSRRTGRGGCRCFESGRHARRDGRPRRSTWRDVAARSSPRRRSPRFSGDRRTTGGQPPSSPDVRTVARRRGGTGCWRRVRPRGPLPAATRTVRRHREAGRRR